MITAISILMLVIYIGGILGGSLLTYSITESTWLVLIFIFGAFIISLMPLASYVLLLYPK